METKAKKHISEEERKTIWVIPNVHDDDITGIYTNAPDNIDIRLHLFETESDEIDYDTVCAYKKCLEGFHDAGKLRQIEPANIKWMLLDTENSLCTVRDHDWEYEFAQVCQLPSGGYGIASTGSECIILEEYSRQDRMNVIELCGKHFNDPPFDPDLENVHVAACFFEAELEKYILSEFEFERMEEARAYLAQNIVDCLVDPQLQYPGESAQEWVPQCVDADRLLPELDKETLIRVALAFDVHAANCACFSPGMASIRLEEYLALHTPGMIYREVGPQTEKSPKFRIKLSGMGREEICQLLLQYNLFLKHNLYERGSVAGVDRMEGFCKKHQGRRNR